MTDLPTCPTGKRRYPTESAARHALRILREAGRTNPGRYYQCDRCHDWHVAGGRKLRGAKP